MLTHIELEAAVVIVLVLHLELENEGIPFGREVDGGVFQVSYPPGVRRGYADDTFSSFVGPDVEGDSVFVALQHREVRMDELDGVFLSTVVL